ncbi:MAG TPA: YidB family protein [Burkholderiales bacterium]|nr:YidB family protein [Burkholderiales bacterium]
MGLLDELLGGLTQGGLGQMSGQQQRHAAQAGSGMANTVAALLPIVLAMLRKQQSGAPARGFDVGGLGGILDQFHRAGFGEQASSWVSTGANLPISPEAMAQVFGRDGLGRIASQAGLTEQQASTGLSQILPEVVDRVTPQGKVPDLDVLAASVGDLQRRFGL